MTEEQIEAVRLALPPFGAATAPEIAYRAGLPLEQTYEALVSLEASYEARVIVDWHEGGSKHGRCSPSWQRGCAA